MQIEETCTVLIMKLTEYIENEIDLLIQIVRTHYHYKNPILLQTLKNCKNFFSVKQKK
jgi:hypothetical protein